MLDQFDVVRSRDSIYQELVLAGFNDGQQSTLDTRKAMNVLRRPDVKSIYKRVSESLTITASHQALHLQPSLPSLT
jgi:hypothetical protein